MNKLRIRPIIHEFGVSYILEKKGLFFWSTDRTNAGSYRHPSFCGEFFIDKHYRNTHELRKAIKDQYGKNACFVVYKV